jgi:HK97 family phage prohead protease
MKHDLLTFPVELRSETGAEGEGEARKIVGRPAVYNQLSQDLGGFRERIVSGAFTKTLQESNVKALWNHNDDYVLGSRKAGTLNINEDAGGLMFEAEPPDTQWARDFMLSVDRGDVDQMSFRFRTIRDRWIQDEDGSVIRELVEVQLIEVSPVTFPAYPQTSVDLRSLGVEIDPDEIQEIAVRSATGHMRDSDRDRIAAIRTVIDQLAAPATSHPDDEARSEDDQDNAADYISRERELEVLL